MKERLPNVTFDDEDLQEVAFVMIPRDAIDRQENAPSVSDISITSSTFAINPTMSKYTEIIARRPSKRYS